MFVKLIFGVNSLNFNGEVILIYKRVTFYSRRKMSRFSRLNLTRSSLPASSRNWTGRRFAALPNSSTNLAIYPPRSVRSTRTIRSSSRKRTTSSSRSRSSTATWCVRRRGASFPWQMAFRTCSSMRTKCERSAKMRFVPQLLTFQVVLRQSS